MQPSRDSKPGVHLQSPYCYPPCYTTHCGTGLAPGRLFLHVRCDYHHRLIRCTIFGALKDMPFCCQLLIAKFLTDVFIVKVSLQSISLVPPDTWTSPHRLNIFISADTDIHQ